MPGRRKTTTYKSKASNSVHTESPNVQTASTDDQNDEQILLQQKRKRHMDGSDGHEVRSKRGCQVHLCTVHVPEEVSIPPHAHPADSEEDTPGISPKQKSSPRSSGSSCNSNSNVKTVNSSKSKQSKRITAQSRAVTKGKEPSTDVSGLKVNTKATRVKAKKEIMQPVIDAVKNLSPAADTVDAKIEKPEMESEEDAKAVKRTGKLVGAHCSISGGLSNAVEEAVTLGAKAFGLFVRSQRTWACKPMGLDAAEDFKNACKKHGFAPNSILPHGSYLMNCGSPNPETLKKSREALLDELQRCEALGLTLYNFHPGSTCGEITVEESLDKIADSINSAHEETQFITTVIENMCCQGNTIGGRFEELKGIIDRVKDKSRIGVCLDTCHAFAAGFDLSTNEGFEKCVLDFDSIVGLKYLRAMHLNDSKGAVGSHLDRHENIGKGKIGLQGFRHIMNDPRFDGIPMILETPPGDYAAEIKTLYELVQK